MMGRGRCGSIGRLIGEREFPEVFGKGGFDAVIGNRHGERNFTRI